MQSSLSKRVRAGIEVGFSARRATIVKDARQLEEPLAAQPLLSITEVNRLQTRGDSTNDTHTKGLDVVRCEIGVRYSRASPYQPVHRCLEIHSCISGRMVRQIL